VGTAGNVRRSDTATPAAFLLMCIIAGGNVVAIRYLVARQGLAPLWTAATRFLVAALIFGVIARSLRAPLPRGKALVGAVLYGALGFGGFFGFGYWGLRDAPAAAGGVILATGPLLTFLLALGQRVETFKVAGLVGAAIVVGGTAVVVSDGLDRGVPFGSLLAILAAAACGAEGAIIVKRSPRVHPAVMNAIGMGVAAAILLVLTLVFDESYALPATGLAWLAQSYLVVAGSVAVFALYLFVLGRWSASAVSYEFVLIPLVGIVFAAWLLDESITGTFAVGTVLVLIGVYFGALRPARAKT
jgi:drug/metabolite transporter (DMT)-like permease